MTFCSHIHLLDFVAGRQTAASLLVLVVLSSPEVMAAQAKWAATVSGTEASAANCSNCDEDISLLLSCTREAPEAQVSLMLLEQREDAFAGKPAVITVKSEAGIVALSGTYSNPGLIGPYPVATVPLDGAFMKLLAHSNSVTFSADNKTAKLGMNGSKAAIAKMTKACR